MFLKTTLNNTEIHKLLKTCPQSPCSEASIIQHCYALRYSVILVDS